MDREKYSDLIKLAAEIVMCKNMPATEYDDWNWPKGMQKTSWDKVSLSANAAENQCKAWAIRLRGIADSLITEKE